MICRKKVSGRASRYLNVLSFSLFLAASGAHAGFDEDVEPIIKDKCNKCHTTTAPQLGTYEQVKGQIANIVTTITVDEAGPEKAKLMPKGGPKLDQASIDKIKAWQSAGMPKDNTQTTSTPPASTDPGTPPPTDTTPPASTDPGTSPGADVAGPGTDNGKPTPLILDLEGKGNFAFADVPVEFDIRGIGKERLSWPKKSAGFLAIDLNDNRKIDNGGELFGDSTVIVKNPSKKAVNGFEALAQYDDNKDNVIDGDDKVFSKLLIWHDKNENGLTDPGELAPLDTLRVTSLSLSFVGHSQIMEGGIEVPLLVSYYVAKDAEGKEGNHVLADIFLTYAKIK